MSEETRRQAITAWSSEAMSIEDTYDVRVGRVLDALTAHMRDELGPKLIEEALNAFYREPMVACADCGRVHKRGSTVVTRGNYTFCPSCLPESKEQPAPAKCEECGSTTIVSGALMHPITCPVVRHKPAQPSPTTEAPETIWAWGHPNGSEASRCWSGVEQIGGIASEYTRSDVVEKRVAEAVQTTFIDLTDILGRGSNEMIKTAARRVVAERDEHEANAASLESASRLLRSDLNAALARVRELEGHTWGLKHTIDSRAKDGGAWKDRAETAERELGEARAKLADREGTITEMVRRKEAVAKMLTYIANGTAKP